jgi:serine/threonine-protein kinase
MPTSVEELRAALAYRYTVERELGAGGMATVYLAQDVKHGRQVAIKVLKPELAHAVGADRFLREIRITAGLNHPHILPLLDSGEADGFLYFVMPYVAGESLRARMDREGPLPVDEALRIAEQVASALEHAHRHEVIHRDIKPENVLLHEGEAMVADFGIAVAVSAAGGERVTETGIAVGTPAFMSPEQASGEKEIDERSDIYSLACVLYEMLGGEVPHSGPTPRAILTQKPLEAVLVQALEAAPEGRFATAAEFGDALRSPEVGWSIAAKRLRLKRRKIVAATAAGLVVLVLAVGAVLQYVRGQAEPTRLVVLPFEYLGAAADEYIADEITQEISSKLAKVSAFLVINRISAEQYKNTDKPVGQIGDELGVEYIVDGTIRWPRQEDSESPVRIRAELIRVEDGASIWNNGYDAFELEILQAQSDVARQIVVALKATLTPAEEERIAQVPTDNLEAYEYYLRGNNHYYRSNGCFAADDCRMALQMYEQAVGLDPNFALAYAQLSAAHGHFYYWSYDLSSERLARAKEAVDRAFQLEPDLPEAHWALGFYYYASRDYARALEYFRTVLGSQPNNSEVAFAIGTVRRRWGEWERAATNMSEAFELDPRNAYYAWNLAATYALMRNYPEAERYYDRAISLAPDLGLVYGLKSWLYLMWEGSVEKARQALQSKLDVEAAPRRTGWPWWQAWWAYLDVLDGQYQQALERLSLGSDTLTYYFAKAGIYHLSDQPQLKHAYFDSLRIVSEARVEEHPDEARFHGILGIAYAGLDRTDDAVREGQRAVDLLPVSEDAFYGTSSIQRLAEIYVMVGEYDAALEQLEYLLSIPSVISVPWLRIDPFWDPLRDHPRFQALLEEYEQ